jgi:chromosome segregation ATPase
MGFPSQLAVCPVCGRLVAVTKTTALRHHGSGALEGACAASGKSLAGAADLAARGAGLQESVAAQAAAHAARERQRRRRKVELAQLRRCLEDFDLALVAVEQARDDPELLRGRLEVATTRQADLDRRWQRVVARERAALSLWARTR